VDTQEIETIKQQFIAGLWPKFLESIAIDGLRGWTGQSVRFAFPVCAIVGENGTGKSTFLKSAACAYESAGTGSTFYPSSFFRSTHWDTVSGINLEYTVREGDRVQSFVLRKHSRRWSFPERRRRRDVFFMDITRTVPLDAAAGYARIARLATNEISSQALDQGYRQDISNILGRVYSNARFVTSDVDNKRVVGLLTREFGEISQFHQGAGEDATLDLMRSVQGIPDTSIILIDEVEASLHPKAQRRLIRFLLKISRLKRVQVVVSTHSPYVLEELPQEARVMLMQGRGTVNVVYGISPEFALSRIDENIHPELYVFVEDRESEILLREILAADADGQDLISRIEIAPVGPANVVVIMGDLARAGRLPYKSVAVLDGDQPTREGFISLPGTNAPERVVFEDLRSRNWPNLPERFGIGAGDLFSYFDDAMLDGDVHQWTSKVGNRIRRSRIGVWETLAAEWAKNCLTRVQRLAIVTSVRDAIAASG
jgi:predicted ATPase